MTTARGQDPSEQHQARPPRRHWQASVRPHWTEIVLAVALIGVGLAQVRIYLRQADIMQTQADIASEQNKISMEAQRAFVFVKEIPWAATTDDKGNVTWNLLISWENNGTTQSKNLIMDSYCPNLSRQDDPTKFRPKDWPIFHRIMGPKQHTFAGSCEPALAELQAAQRHDKWFYIVATAIYDDVFEVPHITEYCQMIDFIIGDLSNANSSPLRSTSACQVHNCADDECKDRDDQRAMLLAAPLATKPMPSRPIP